MAAGAVSARTPSSLPSPDAPELARLGPFDVGLTPINLTPEPRVDSAPRDAFARPLSVQVWYPARARKSAKRVVYHYALPGEPPRGFVAFSSPGIAVRGAAPAPGRFPLVVISHGYSNEPEAMSWLAETLASKGYVVAAIAHRDPDISDRNRAGEVIVRRPLDIVFAVRALRAQIAAGAPGLASADPTRTVLIGYSMGGYGVLTAAGAGLELRGNAAGSPLAPFTRGQPRAGELIVPDVKAVVAISPAGSRYGAWGNEGLAGVRSPLLLIGGSRDATVGFADGIAPVFEQAIHAPRYFLIFQNAGHALGLDAAPDGALRRLWDFQWFEDPVWRKDRILGISQHLITAFLDRYAKGDDSRAAYLDTDVVSGVDGAWPETLKGYDAVSSGGPGLTWKGFHRNTAAGLELRHRAPAP